MLLRAEHKVTSHTPAPRAQETAPHRAAAAPAAPTRRSHEGDTWETRICYCALHFGGFSQAEPPPCSLASLAATLGSQRPNIGHLEAGDVCLFTVSHFPSSGTSLPTTKCYKS